LWAAPEHHADALVGSALQTAVAGSSARLGHLLAPAGVRYIAFVTHAAPDAGSTAGRDESALAAALARQLDLTLSRSDDNGLVYQNDAWMPMRAVVPPEHAGDVHDDQNDALAAAVRSEGTVAQGVPLSGGQTPAIGPGTFLLSEAASPRWRVTTSGHAAPRHPAFGWTNGYTLTTNGTARVAYQANPSAAFARDVEIALALVLVIAWFVTRRAPAPARDPDADDTAVIDLAAVESAERSESTDVEAGASR